MPRTIKVKIMYHIDGNSDTKESVVTLPAEGEEKYCQTITYTKDYQWKVRLYLDHKDASNSREGNCNNKEYYCTFDTINKKPANFDGSDNYRTITSECLDSDWVQEWMSAVEAALAFNPRNIKHSRVSATFEDTDSQDMTEIGCCDDICCFM